MLNFATTFYENPYSDSDTHIRDEIEIQGWIIEHLKLLRKVIDQTFQELKYNKCPGVDNIINEFMKIRSRTTVYTTQQNS